jgi:hypothetical protein
VVDFLDDNWYFSCHFYRQANPGTIHVMGEFRSHSRKHRLLPAACVTLVLCLNLSCVRSEPLPASASDPRSLPFHSNPPGDDSVASGTLSSDAQQVPFRLARRVRVLPAGTLLTVQLETSFSAGMVRAGDAFNATLTAPVTEEGKPLLDRGTAFIGRVESIRSLEDDTKGAAGYFMLTLNSINIGGKQLAVQTSTLFARETLGPAKDLGVQKDHYLTFRLIAPVDLSLENPAETVQSGSQTTQ